MRSAVRVVVVGGGVIGLCAAHALRRRDAEVTIVDRGRCGALTSAGNAGWVSPGLAAPIPAPGVVPQALRWMLDRESPFLIRPRLDPGFVAWLARFWRACRAERHRAGLEATLALARATPELFDALRDDGVEFEMHSDGLLFLVLDERRLAPWQAMYAELAELGFDAGVTVLDRAAVHELEPAVGDGVAAGLLARIERHVRPETLTAGLMRWLRGRDVRIEEECSVAGLRREGARWRMRAGDEELVADRVVVAAGVWTRELLAPLGVRVPLEAAKGYSITAPAADGGAPRHPLYLTEAKLGVSPFDRALRIAGTLELAGLDLRVNPRRVEAIARHAAGYLAGPAPDTANGSTAWAGLRPVAPDGLPLIGAVGALPGLYVATGHGMLGVTLAPATGQALAPLVLEDRLVPELEPLRPDRFGRHAVAGAGRS